MSTTLEKALGEVGLWDRAEVAIASAMDNFVGEGNWRVNRRLEEAPCSGGGLYSAAMSDGKRYSAAMSDRWRYSVVMSNGWRYSDAMSNG